ncbi:MAG: hypothetical protein A3F70_12525 [Acidobacteria bacterium RIFCSPLOWO2_12_FULL_67_14]|nr:MAG: hypothetical protein A3H29_00790 [Acidobacteria bacterium RIFCSPLOWO2_02_FULL_67_21]OFW37199.1 MAG: hypothetical protein A3F70_12525 [Acidobacteria bacterium RIFCSPLOWO2_12_FULL_67_14]
MTSDARRADWRFLLPMPDSQPFAHMVLLGGPPGLAALLRALGVALDISRSVPPGRTADAVVVLHDSPIAPHRAALALAGGGVFYAEVDRRTARGLLETPRRLCRRLRAARLRPSALYWVVPHFDDARRFVPLDSAGALDWYFDAAWRQLSYARMAAARLARLWMRGNSARFGSVAPCYSVVAVEDSVSTTIPAVLTDLTLKSHLIDSGASFALVTSGQDDGSRVVMLPFGRGEAPRAAIKVSRLPAFNGHTTREHRRLLRLRSQLSADLRPTLPRPYQASSWHGLAVAVESFAPGPSMAASTGYRGATAAQQIDDLRAATEWLARVHSQWQVSEAAWTDSEIDRWVEGPCRDYARTFGFDIRTDRLFTDTYGHAQQLRGKRCPIVLQHDDFGPWNVHRSDQGLTVIDWEADGEVPQGGAPALQDLIYFVTHWFFVAMRAHSRSSRRHAYERLVASNPGSDIAIAAARAAVDSYMRALRIDPAFLRVLTVVTWVRHAVARHLRDQSSPVEHNQYVDYVKTLAVYAHVLFDDAIE